MFRSDEMSKAQPSSLAAWRGWLGLAWALVFAILYAGMVVRERAPWIWDRLAR